MLYLVHNLLFSNPSLVLCKSHRTGQFHWFFLSRGFVLVLKKLRSSFLPWLFMYAFCSRISYVPVTQFDPAGSYSQQIPAAFGSQLQMQMAGYQQYGLTPQNSHYAQNLVPVQTSSAWVHVFFFIYHILPFFM